MKGLRLLNNGEWNKPPVLTAARQVFALGLARHFPQCTLGDAASFVNGTSYDVDRISTLAPLPIIRISNLTDPNSAYIRTDEDLGAKFWIRPGDLLVSWSASFKSALWAGPEGYLNQHIFKVTENSGFDRRYIRHIIEASLDAMQERVVGIGMMHLRRADFLGHHVPAPPLGIQAAVAAFLDWIEGGRVGPEPRLPSELAEQRRVVARIEELAGQIGEAHSLRVDAVREVATLAHHILADLFPPTSDRCVGDYVTFQTGYAFKSEWFTDTGIRLARNANIGHGVLDWTQTARIPQERRAEFSRFEVDRGDILITLDRPIISSGVKVARVRDGDLPCLLLQRVARAQFRSDAVLPDYFYCWLRSRHFMNAIDPGRSNGVPHISHKDIEKIPFAPPSLAEQGRIVAELDALQAQVASLKRVQAETAAELDALLPAILDRAFKGELV
jgi:hypothetical protein